MKLKRISALLVTLLMLLTVVTVPVFADSNAVASIGTTEYSSLADALNACQAGETVELLKNVTLSGNWTPIEDFKGTFDGNGYTISGLNVDTVSKAAMFASMGSATVKDLVIDGATVRANGYSSSTYSYAAFICADCWTNTVFENITVKDSDVAAVGEYVGGIVGAGYPSKISGCTISGESSICGLDQVGGLVGYTKSGDIVNNTIDETYIYAENDRAGGIAGKVQCSSGENCTVNISNNTVTAVLFSDYGVTGGIYGQIMGDWTKYTVKCNYIDCVGATNPIGTLRSGQVAAFTDVLATNIVGNWWTDDALDADSFDYAATTTQTIYRGVAKIGTKYYESLEKAVAAVNANETITLVSDCAGNGIQVASGKTVKVDFAGHTYTVDGATVGSTGTKTQAFQLLTGSTVEFKNGKITSSVAKMLIQNYANLTLDNMELDGSNLADTSKTVYTLSNNNGDVLVKDSTITARATKGIAFDVCGYASYAGANVTVEDSTINGYVELYSDSSSHVCSLALKGTTTLSGINMSTGAEMITATKESTVTVSAPAGYKWNADGKLVAYNYVAKIGDVKYESLEEAFAAVKSGETITLLKDCAGNGIKVASGKTVKVDFAGYTYTVDGTTVGSTGTETQAFQLLTGSTVEFKNGKITSSVAKMLIQNYSNLTLDNMELDGSNLADTSKTVYTLSNNNGDVLVKDSTITARATKGIAFDVCGYASYAGANVTVEDSTINGYVELYSDSSSHVCSLALKGTTTLSGINMSTGAEMITATKESTVSVSAPAGYKWNADGKLVACDYVAAIGDVKYESLAEAFAAVKSGETITLLANCAGNGVKVASGKNFTVDFAGYTYTVDGTTVGSTGTETSAFQLLAGSTIVFKNGKITSDKAKILIQNYANLTLDNMNLDGSNLADTTKTAYTLSTNNGKTVIKDTTITARATNGVAFDACTFSSYTSNEVVLEGASVINGNIEVSTYNAYAAELKLTAGTVNGNVVFGKNGDKVSVSKTNATVTGIPAGYKWNAEGKLVAIEYVATIGEAKYETLADAIAAVKDGETITLLKDCAGNGVIVASGKNFTVDFAGYTYTVDGTTVGSTGTETSAFQLLKDSTITFKNGKITSDKAKILIQNYANLTLDNMNLDGSNLADTSTTVYTLSTNNGKTVIKDTTITARATNGVAFDACTFSSYTSNEVVLEGTSVINGNIEVSTYNVYAAELKLTAGTVNGEVVFGNNGNKVSVSKTDATVTGIPSGYEWNDAGKLVATDVKVTSEITEEVEATGLDDVMTAEGASSIELKVAELDDNDAAEAIYGKIAETDEDFDESVAVKFYDIDLVKNGTTNITETTDGKVIEVKITLGDVKNVKAYRYHNGEAEALTEATTGADGTYYFKDGVLHIFTSKFSAYTATFVNNLKVSLVLDDTISIRIKSGSADTTGFTVNGEEFNADGIVDIAAGSILDAAEKIEITIAYNGEPIGVYNVSVAAYCLAVVNSTTTTDTEKQLAAAIFMYADAAISANGGDSVYDLVADKDNDLAGAIDDYVVAVEVGNYSIEGNVDATASLTIDNYVSAKIKVDGASTISYKKVGETKATTVSGDTIEIADVGARYLTNEYEVTADGEKITVSIAAIAQASGTGLGSALACYAAAAAAYFA